MWTYMYVHQEFLPIFGQCINVLNYKWVMWRRGGKVASAMEFRFEGR